jgi:phosphoserine phosphatase
MSTRPLEDATDFPKLDPGRRSTVMLEELKRLVLSAQATTAGGSIALFDLDNTLLIGDIGEAVFAQLQAAKFQLAMAWHVYRSLTRTNPHQAYVSATTALRGLQIELIESTARQVLELRRDAIRVGDDNVPVPRPHRLLSAFVQFLRDQSFQIYVISGSNHISTQIAGEVLFGLPRCCCFGIQTRVEGGRLTDELLSPLPIGEGKAHLYRQLQSERLPLVTATDSRLDLPLLRLTRPDGFSLWRGEDRVDYETVRALLGPRHRLFLVPSHSTISTLEGY